MSSTSLTFRTTQTIRESHEALCWAHGTRGCEQVDVATVRAWFASGAELAPLCEVLQRAGATDIAIAEVADQDWNASWRESIQPVQLTPGTWVSPTWRAPAIAPGEHWIKIEPKMAFGTGHHESTRLAAWGISQAARSGATGSLLDIGTGSGVLCFAALNAGFTWCVGAEIDQDCRENLAENRSLNAPGSRVQFVIGSSNALARARFDTVVMNMIFNESAPLLGDVRALAAPGGRLVWSGILYEGRAEALDAAAAHGFELIAEQGENEWWGGCLRATSSA